MKKLYFILFVSTTFLNSCESYIDVDTPTNQISTEIVFESEGTANAAIADIYASLRNSSLIAGGSDGLGAILGIYTDELDNYFLDNNGYIPIYNHQVSSTNTILSKVWTTSYQQIYALNLLLEGLNNSTTLKDSFKHKLKGEALVLRSILYFYLNQLFGDIPYTISTDYELNSTLTRTNSKLLLDHLKLDLKIASELLNDNYSHAERIYPNKKVADIMLCKIYLLEGSWSLAENLSKEIMSSSNYTFEDDIERVFKKQGQHIIWQLKPQNSGDATKEAILYYFNNSVPKTFALSNKLISSFEDGDLRKRNWISSVNYSNEVYYRSSKYKNHSNSTNTDEYSIIFRLEEVYLLLAEALNYQNKTDEAVYYINKIRNRAGLSLIKSNITKEDCTEYILIEKRHEFFCEFGQRFMDLKRNNRLHYLENWNSHYKYFPIPERELSINPNLNPQNHGY